MFNPATFARLIVKPTHVCVVILIFETVDEISVAVRTIHWDRIPSRVASSRYVNSHGWSRR